MQKDFLTITPDSGGGSQEVTVQAGANYGDAHSTTITISGGGMTRTIEVSQAQGRFTASKTGSIQFNNSLHEQITSRLYLTLIDYNDKNSISLFSRLDLMSPNSNNTEQISGEVTWYGTRTFTTNRLKLVISSGKNESIDITLNGQTLVRGTFTSKQEVRFSTITISPGDTLRVSGTVRYS